MVLLIVGFRVAELRGYGTAHWFTNNCGFTGILHGSIPEIWILQSKQTRSDPQWKFLFSDAWTTAIVFLCVSVSLW
jgi:hypothetical protein